MLPFYAKAVLRNPWAYLPLLLPLLALAFRGREEGVALLGFYGALALLLPPLVLALSTPLLAEREEWGFLAGLGHPFRLYLEALLGVGLGLSLPLLAGLFLAAGVLGLGERGLLLPLFGLALAWVFLVLVGLVSALTLNPGRATAFGLLLWGVLTLGYDPLLLGLYGAFAQYPVEGLFLVLVLLNPVDLLRVALLHLLDAPVVVGVTAYLLRALLGAYLPLLVLALLLQGLLGVLLAAWVFARRER
ncbi:hypothetical protein [Thermus filiformis]|uniref:Uncharacterized protein n=1 Tax=Thermus filiformis TaxID=276 RepID=A0A0A2WTC4_THEFI|nr:hypothetical protein [Thermus filiformis]KGQ23058.2 hypothetical protein THFILI_07740 [Thermus filiformis]